MARSLWKGAISFGLVTVPVALYAATESRGEVHFRLLHRKDRSPIDYRRFCREEDVPVAWEDIVKGYEYEKGEYVVITDEDFDKAKVEATQTYTVQDFVAAEEIGDVYFDHPYYVAPAGRGADKPYALLRDALAEARRIGVGTIVLRQREHLAAIEPLGEALVLTTLRWAHEIRSPGELDLPKIGAGYQKREMGLARQLIQTLEAPWEPGKYKDTYRDVLLDIIDRKLKGEEIAAPEVKRPSRVVDLVKALEQSVARGRKDLAKAEPRPRRGRPAPRARRGKRAA